MSPRRPEDEAEILELIRSIDVRAPERLHSATAELIAQHAESRRRSPRLASRGERLRLGAQGAHGARLRLAGGLAALAAVVLALAVILSGGGSSPLSVREAAAVTLRTATLAGPPESSRQRGQLAAAVDGIPFPYWEERFGWRSVGQRSDSIGGRTVRTVFYSDQQGRRVGYAIVAGTPPPRLAAGALRWSAGTPYRLLTENGSRVVAWLRAGHLCIIGGRGVNDSTLLRLASWEDRGSAV